MKFRFKDGLMLFIQDGYQSRFDNVIKLNVDSFLYVGYKKQY